jgi:diguanylate cyclase (GGDEF)-like protein
MLSVNEEDIDRITAAFHALLLGQAPGPVDLPDEYPDNEIRQLVDYLNTFLLEYGVLGSFTLALSRGDLDVTAPRGRNHLLQPLKNLQANLRHLTWKTQQIATGDFAQRVDFMGEFSSSFNSMVAQLAAARQELLRKNQELETLSRTDPLTGLLNRRGVAEVLKTETARATRYKRPFTILIADIDHFKHTNDTYGHEAGDAVLAHTARVFLANVRETDQCARWGGEEFLVSLVETGLSDGVLVAERLRAALEGMRVEHAGMKLGATVSIGVSVFQEGENPDDCIRRSDRCLYCAKEAGRNQVWRQEPSGVAARFVHGEHKDAQ